MAVRHQLPVLRESLKWCVLELRVVAVDVLEHLRLYHEERAVDPAFAGLRLLRERRDAVALELQRTEARRRSHRCQRGETTVRTVEVEEVMKVDRRHAVAPRDHARV